MTPAPFPFHETTSGACNPYQIGVVFLHPACNMTCTFCVTENTTATMRYDQALRTLDCLEARGIRDVVLGGGEPFAWPHGVLRLAGAAKDRGFHVQVGTNGVALPDGFADLTCVDRFVLPLDAADAAMHNTLRRYQDRHHQLILDRLAALRHAGRTVSISTVVTARNAAQLPALGGLLDGYCTEGGRLHAWHLYKFLPEGRGGHAHAAELNIPDSEYHRVCDAVKAAFPTMCIYKRPDMRHSRTVDFFWFEGERLRAGSECWAYGAFAAGRG